MTNIVAKVISQENLFTDEYGLLITYKKVKSEEIITYLKPMNEPFLLRHKAGHSYLSLSRDFTETVT